MAEDGSEVRSVEARVYGSRLESPVGYAKGFIERRESAVARLVTADGTVGWGEAYAPAAPAAAAIAAFGRHLVGTSVFARVAVGRALARRPDAEAETPVGAAARSALALAATDAAAKLLGCPVRAQLGGDPDPPLRVYASALWFQQGTDPTAHYGDAIRAARQQGFAAVKAKIGLGVDADRRAIARMRAAGESMALMVDANQAYDPAAADAVAALAEEAGFVWLEEPLPADRLADYAALRSCSRLAIAGGETVTSLGEARSWLDADAVDVLQPDVCLAGGVEAAAAIAALATTTGVVVAPHCYGLGIGLAASLHWAAAIATGDEAAAPVWIEVDTSPHPTRDALLTGTDWYRDGGTQLSVPAAPGLGLDPDRIASFRLR